MMVNDKEAEVDEGTVTISTTAYRMDERRTFEDGDQGQKLSIK
jgi:hypothetical protein